MQRVVAVQYRLVVGVLLEEERLQLEKDRLRVKGGEVSTDAEGHCGIASGVRAPCRQRSIR